MIFLFNWMIFRFQPLDFQFRTKLEKSCLSNEHQQNPLQPSNCTIYCPGGIPIPVSCMLTIPIQQGTS